MKAYTSGFQEAKRQALSEIKEWMTACHPAHTQESRVLGVLCQQHRALKTVAYWIRRRVKAPK